MGHRLWQEGTPPRREHSLSTLSPARTSQKLYRHARWERQMYIWEDEDEKVVNNHRTLQAHKHAPWEKIG